MNVWPRLNEEFKRRISTQTVVPSSDNAAMLFWALLAASEINMRKVDGWTSLATLFANSPINSPLQSRHDAYRHQA